MAVSVRCQDSEPTRLEHGVNFPAFVSLNSQQDFEKVLFHGPLVPTVLMKDVARVPGLAELTTRNPGICVLRWICGFTWAAGSAGN